MRPEWGELGQRVSRGCGDDELSLGTIGQQAKQGPVPIGTDSLSFQTLAWPHRELSSSEAGGIIQEKAGREHPVLRERVSEGGASMAPTGLCTRTWLVDDGVDFVKHCFSRQSVQTPNSS